MKKILATVLALITIVNPFAVARDIPKSETPIVSNNYGYLDGNKMKDNPYRIAYIAGVNDMMVIIRQEILAMVSDSNNADRLGISNEQWAQMSGDEQLALILSALMVKLNDSISRIPQNTTLGKLDEITAEYLTKHPDELHNDAALLVWKALLEADWK